MQEQIDSIREILHNEEKSVRLALFDAKRQVDSEALYRWENNESGSIVDMITAYQHVFDEQNIHKPLSVTLIDEIRLQMKNAATGSYGGLGQGHLNNKNISARHFSFNLDKSDAGEMEGLKDSALERIRKESEVLRTELISNSGGEVYDGIELPYRVDRTYGTNQTLSIATASGDVSEKYYRAIIGRYNKKIKDVDSEDKKLCTILELVRDLERTHPYQDFNCRTFCVLVLNRELVKNGFKPSLMEDPNVFDFLPIDINVRSMHEKFVHNTKVNIVWDWDVYNLPLQTLKSSVQVGQENFEYLKNHNVVHEHDPSNKELFDYFAQGSQNIIQQFEQDIKLTNEDITSVRNEIGQKQSKRHVILQKRAKARRVVKHYKDMIKELETCGSNAKQEIESHKNTIEKYSNRMTKYTDSIASIEDSIEYDKNYVNKLKEDILDIESQQKVTQETWQQNLQKLTQDIKNASLLQSSQETISAASFVTNLQPEASYSVLEQNDSTSQTEINKKDNVTTKTQAKKPNNISKSAIQKAQKIGDTIVTKRTTAHETRTHHMPKPQQKYLKDRLPSSRGRSHHY